MNVNVIKDNSLEKNISILLSEVISKVNINFISHSYENDITENTAIITRIILKIEALYTNRKL